MIRLWSPAHKATNGFCYFVIYGQVIKRKSLMNYNYLVSTFSHFSKKVKVRRLSGNMRTSRIKVWPKKFRNLRGSLIFHPSSRKSCTISDPRESIATFEIYCTETDTQKKKGEWTFVFYLARQDEFVFLGVGCIQLWTTLNTNRH